MAANGFDRRTLPVDADGRVAIDDAAPQPGRRPAGPGAPDRGGQPPRGGAAAATRSPGCAASSGCRWSSTRRRRWVTSTARWAPTRSTRRRASGWRARVVSVCSRCVRTLMQRLRPRLPPPEWARVVCRLPSLELGEANIAARVGFSVALRRAPGRRARRDPRPAGRGGPDEPDRPRRRARAGGWSKPVDEPSAITTLAPLDGADPQKVRAWLIAERRIVTTVRRACERAPLEMADAGAAGLAARRHHRRRPGPPSPTALTAATAAIVTAQPALCARQQVGRALHPALLVASCWGIGTSESGGVGRDVRVDEGRPDLVDLPVLAHRGAQLVLVDLVRLCAPIRPGRRPWRTPGRSKLARSRRHGAPTCR